MAISLRQPLININDLVALERVKVGIVLPPFSSHFASLAYHSIIATTF